MSANTYHIISIAGFVLAGIFFLAAVILFFVFDIRSVINDLSGKTAARQIAELRNKNYSNSTARKINNVYDNYKEQPKQPEVNVEISKTDQMKVHQSHRLDAAAANVATPVNHSEDVTTLLNQSEDVTTLLNQEEATTVLGQAEMEQSDSEDETTILQNEQPGKFKVVHNEISVHTEDIII